MARLMTKEECFELGLFIQQLRVLGIDPDDPDHLEKYIQKTRELHQEEYFIPDAPNED